ncbi:hypothetical protein OZ668_11600 [Elizabethkingia sp. HX XZB]|uniref:hypothetical protein n=1 Tax=Elizabethkingia sp. HX XZB TaxID=3003193 RepID=UPI002A24A955|nr:hypothetical protein [Elizabethkingia sp. HX XZB]MDX8568636.1 hypothetical protein [Elizabethkingia sp. HX XZB]
MTNKILIKLPFLAACFIKQSIFTNDTSETLAPAGEISHTFGMKHPKGKGGNNGIMKYPPEKPNQSNANFVGNGSFMPAVEKKKP